MKVFDTSDRVKRIAEKVNSTSSADFVKRLLDQRRQYVVNDDGSFSTHGLAYRDDGKGNAVVYPTVQSVGDGLHAFDDDMAYDRAVYRGDTLQMSTPDAKIFTENYKQAYPMYFQPDLLPNGSGELAYDVQVPEVRGLVPFMYDPSRGTVEESAVVSILDPVKDAARRIMAVENSKTNPKGGWNAKEGRWYPHKSVEGGADTIAYGIKLSNGTPEAKLALKQGYLTDEQATEFADTLAQKYYDAAKRVYDKKYGEGEWDKLSDKSQSILVDYSYNPGLQKFPSLMEGFHSGNMDMIRKNYKRYSGGKELGRNKKLLEEIDTLENEYPIFRRNGGPIRIKPENRGKFTALKKRTGHSASWFKAHGTPAQKKMAVFALNSRKWHHGDGGFLQNYFDDGGPYGVIPLGGDYLQYLQETPDLYGGTIDPSVITAALPEKFNGSQETARRYAEGYLYGVKPVSEAMNRAGQKIFNTVDTVVGLTPTPAGAITWLGHMGADTANGEYGKVGRDLGMAAAMGLGLGALGRGYGYLRNYVDEATNFGEDIFRAMLENTPGRVSTNFTYALPAARATMEAVPAATKSYEIADLGGGYMLKSLMRGNPLEKQLSKNGTVNVNNVRALANKGSKVEQVVIDKVLSSEEFAGQKSIDYNKFRKAVQDELITYDRTPDTRYDNYGGEALNWGGSDKDIKEWALSKGYYKPARERMPYQKEYEWPSEFIDTRTGDEYTIGQLEPLYKKEHGVTLDTYTFSSPRIPNGSARHYDPNTLGHSRTYTIADEPDVLHVMESQSDWAQRYDKKNFGGEYNQKRINSLERRIKNLRDSINGEMEGLRTKKMNDGSDMSAWFEDSLRKQIDKDKQLLKELSNELDMRKNPKLAAQQDYLADNFTSRQIQENLRYAAEKGQKKMRYPTRETAAKIEGYGKGEAYYDVNGNDVTKSGSVTELSKEWKNKYDDIEKRIQDLTNKDEEFGSIAFRRHENDKTVWLTQNTYSDVVDLEGQKRNILENHSQLKPGITKKEVYTIDGDPKSAETILQKYDAFPKQFKKLYKNAEIRTVTDPKGNTWYEVDVPEDYLKQEWAFEEGGSMILPKRMMEKYSPDKLKKAIQRIKENKFEEGGPKRTTAIYLDTPVRIPDNMNDAWDATTFVENYYSSDGYKKRMADAGLPAKDLKLKTEMYVYPDMDIWDSYTSGNGEVNIGLVPYYMDFPTSNTILGKTIIDKAISEDNKYGEGLYPGIVAAHEMAHLNPLFNTRYDDWYHPLRKNKDLSPYYGNDYTKVPPYWMYLLRPNIQVNEHDAEASENYSDLMALRYFLQKNGIFDSMGPNAEFKSSDYDKIFEHEGGKNLRYLMHHSKDAVIKAINEIAGVSGKEEFSPWNIRV